MNRSGDVEASRSISSTMLAGVRIRKPEAWDRLVDVWGPVIYGWCRKRNLQGSDADDVVQDVLFQVFQKVPEFQRKSFRAWISTITHNKIVDHFRNNQKRPKAVGGSSANQRIQTLPDPTDNGSDDDSRRQPDADTDSLIVRQVLGVLRADFSEQTFQAFWRTKVDGLPAADVADELGITKDAVRQAACRVLRRLRDELTAAGML